VKKYRDDVVIQIFLQHPSLIGSFMDAGIQRVIFYFMQKKSVKVVERL
jgi:hypothetical protein